MPVPKRRTSKTNKRMRRSHHALTPPNAVECAGCGELVLSHQVCPKCGYYKDRVRINVEGD